MNSSLEGQQLLLHDNNDTILGVMVSLCDHVDFSQLLFVSKRFRDIVAWNMNVYVDSLLAAAASSSKLRHGPLFRWKNGYSFKDVSLQIRCPMADDGCSCTEEEDDDTMFSWGEETVDPLKDYIQRNGAIIIDHESYCWSNCHSMMQSDDNVDGDWLEYNDWLEHNNYDGDDETKNNILLEDAVGVDFSDRMSMIRFLMDLATVACVHDNKTPLIQEPKRLQSRFQKDMLHSLSESNTLRNENTSYTFEIELKYNQSIDETSAMTEFVETCAQIRYATVISKELYAYTLRIRHLASILFQRAVSIRQTCFSFEDDTHPGFGPVHREGLAYRMVMEDGRHFEMYSFTFYNGPYD